MDASLAVSQIHQTAEAALLEEPETRILFLRCLFAQPVAPFSSLRACASALPDSLLPAADETFVDTFNTQFFANLSIDQVEDLSETFADFQASHARVQDSAAIHARLLVLFPYSERRAIASCVAAQRWLCSENTDLAHKILGEAFQLYQSMNPVFRDSDTPAIFKIPLQGKAPCPPVPLGTLLSWTNSLMKYYLRAGEWAIFGKIVGYMARKMEFISDEQYSHLHSSSSLSPTEYSILSNLVEKVLTSVKHPELEIPIMSFCETLLSMILIRKFQSYFLWVERILSSSGTSEQKRLFYIQTCFSGASPHQQDTKKRKRNEKDSSSNYKVFTKVIDIMHEWVHYWEMLIKAISRNGTKLNEMQVVDYATDIFVKCEAIDEVCTAIALVDLFSWIGKPAGSRLKQFLGTLEGLRQREAQKAEKIKSVVQREKHMLLIDSRLIYQTIPYIQINRSHVYARLMKLLSSLDIESICRNSQLVQTYLTEEKSNTTAAPKLLQLDAASLFASSLLQLIKISQELGFVYDCMVFIQINLALFSVEYGVCLTKLEGLSAISFPLFPVAICNIDIVESFYDLYTRESVSSDIGFSQEDKEEQMERHIQQLDPSTTSILRAMHKYCTHRLSTSQAFGNQ